MEPRDAKRVAGYAALLPDEMISGQQHASGASFCHFHERQGANAEEGWRNCLPFRRITGGMDTCFDLKTRDQHAEAA